MKITKLSLDRDRSAAGSRGLLSLDLMLTVHSLYLGLNASERSCTVTRDA